MLQLHVVDHQATELHVQYLHAGEGAVDEDEGITLLDVLAHLILDDATQGIKTLSHISRIRVEVERIGIAECEHRLIQ